MAETNNDSGQAKKQKGHQQSPAKNKASREKNDKQKPKSNTYHVWLIALTLINILLIASVLAFVIYSYQHNRQWTNRFNNDLSSIDQKINNQQQLLSQHSETITHLRQQLRAIKQKDTTNTNYWVLKKAEHLLTLARYNLKFQNDAQTGLAILQTVQTLLQQEKPGELIEVKSRLSKAVTQIKPLAKQDTTNLVIKLNALTDNVEQLSVKTAVNTHPDQKITSEKAGPDQTPTDSFWQKSWNNIKQGLLKAVTIRHHKDKVQPFIPPENRPFVIANVQSQLRLAQFAVLHQQPELFDNSLKTAAQWLDNYFEPSDKTQSVISDINSLRDKKIAPELPNLDKLNQAVQQALAELDQQTN